MPFLSIVRLRDTKLPLFGTVYMDINYILRREQVSLYNASVAASGPARLAHKGMAIAYANLLADAGFPHRDATIAYVGPVTVDEGDRWMDDGGPDAASQPLSNKCASSDGASLWRTPVNPLPSHDSKEPMMRTPSPIQPLEDQVPDIAGELNRHGITRVSVDQFEVNGFRYSHLRDAIAEAKRLPRHAAGDPDAGDSSEPERRK